MRISDWSSDVCSSDLITERVVGVVGPAGFRVRIGTFHSLSCRILRDYPAEAGLRNQSFLIADDDEARLLFVDAVDLSGAWPAYEEPVRRDEEEEATWRSRCKAARKEWRSEEHTSELQSLMRISYAVFSLKKKN